MVESSETYVPGNIAQAAHLIVHDLESGRDRHVLLVGQRLVVGRGKSTDIVLHSDRVSREHACIELGSEGYILIDLTSLNGTRVNGNRVETEFILQHGDTIEFANVRATFHLGAIDPDATIFDDEGGLPHSSTSYELVQATREIRTGGVTSPIRLSRREFDFLDLLHGRRGTVVPHSQVGEALWGRGLYDMAMLHALVHRLRAKLNGVPITLVAVPGIGFRLTETVDS